MYLLFLRIEFDELEIIPIRVSISQTGEARDVETALDEEMREEEISAQRSDAPPPAEHERSRTESLRSGLIPRVMERMRHMTSDSSKLSLVHKANSVTTRPTVVSSTSIAESSGSVVEYQENITDDRVPIVPQSIDETNLPGLPPLPLEFDQTSYAVNEIHRPSDTNDPLAPATYFKRTTAAALRSAIQEQSKQASLLILNLPASLQVQNSTNLFGLHETRRAGAFMELFEFLTADISRSLLVQCHDRTRQSMKVGIDNI
jgi:hypothetical protein